MPTTMTLEGVRPGAVARFFGRLGLRGDDRGQWLGDAWTDEAAAIAPSPGAAALSEGATSMLGWGVLAFAGATAAIRGYRAVKRRASPMYMQGYRRRRRY